MGWTVCACAREIHLGANAGDRQRGVIAQARWPEDAAQFSAEYAGQIQTVYLDPPFDTGKPFDLRIPVGETGWQTGKPFVTLRAYNDRWNGYAYAGMMRAAIRTAHAMLKDEGALFLHIDPRKSPMMRTLLDEVFGESNFVNEIVWAYETGGRATVHFSRKHDVLLFYRKSERSYFDISAAAMPRTRRHNHMRRSSDEQGRNYSAIDVGGKEYRYYDDDPVYPSDVWTDIAPLQQRDPRRTGFDTQKPAALIQRVVGCTSKPGDWVADLFVGSGTTAQAAAEMGRNFVGADTSTAALISTRKRLLGNAFELVAPCTVFDTNVQPTLDADITVENDRLCAVLNNYTIDPSLCMHSPEALAHVDQWSFGMMRGDNFHDYADTARDKRHPRLDSSLNFPVEQSAGGVPALIVVDILGRRLAFEYRGVV
ncbi:hypothetical protein AGMMS49992_13820 [Clostridia bacterium]|nr:hypothetical protein AGMMS49992_13820 [Clostridia bacterium]